MKTINAIIVVVVIIISGIVAVIAVGALITGQQQQTDFCNEWSLDLEQRRAELSGEFFQTDQEWAIFNQQVNEYNAQCAS